MALLQQLAKMRVVWCAAALAAAPSVCATVIVVNGSEAVVGSLMRREQNAASADGANTLSTFVENNCPESTRLYSSIWANEPIGVGHARSMLDSPQAWSSAANDVDQWMIINAQQLQAVNGVFFQARNQAAAGTQLVTKAHFEYSKDCISYTPVEQNRVFNTGVTASNTKFLVRWGATFVAKCVKIWIDGWQHHISMRAGLSSRKPQDEDWNPREFIQLNPPEARRSYSSVWGNQAPGIGHARSSIGSPQGWSALHNNNGQWMILTLDYVYSVNGAYFRGRNKHSCCGNQIVTKVRFETSRNCVDYTPVEASASFPEGKVFDTMVQGNQQVKRFVAWEKDIEAQCVKIWVAAWSGHITMRAALSAWLNRGIRWRTSNSMLTEVQSKEEEEEEEEAEEEQEEETTEFRTVVKHDFGANLSAAQKGSFATYGDGNPAHVAEDFPSVTEGRTFDFYGDGTPTHVE